MNEAAERVFLFLQGPHGPFFRRLALRLTAQGGLVRRVTFNPGDEAEWRGAGPFERFLGPISAYTDWLAHYIAEHGITDIVLYGDSRPEHALAIEAARPRGILCHCLEEGYLRPHHVTYERWGNNGNSPLHEISLARMARALGPAAPPPDGPHDGWGAHRSHLWHSALYHARLLLPSRQYGRHDSRRGLTLWRELGHYLRRLAGLPLRRFSQTFMARRLLASGRSYHLALLQLSFDSSMQAHSDYRNTAGFAADCIVAFARGAPAEDTLVFKSHPFEDGRERLGEVISREAGRLNVADRVLFLDGGPSLASLLDGARSAVTVNSTAAQQALWRGLPVAALGCAVYDKPGLVSDQPLESFFADPQRPDQQAYWQYRQFLSKTSQLKGSFYSRPGIAVLLDALASAMLVRTDPYERVLALAPAPEPDASPSFAPGFARIAQIETSHPASPAEVPEISQPHRVAV
jgi:capsular polysaccharide export protein